MFWTVHVDTIDYMCRMVWCVFMFTQDRPYISAEMWLMRVLHKLHSRPGYWTDSITVSTYCVPEALSETDFYSEQQSLHRNWILNHRIISTSKTCPTLSYPRIIDVQNFQHWKENPSFKKFKIKNKISVFIFNTKFHNIFSYLSLAKIGVLHVEKEAHTTSRKKNDFIPTFYI